jgi:hypothetical protein
LLFYIKQLHFLGETVDCVLAYRLSENSNVSVLVVERGIAKDIWLSRIPLLRTNIRGPSNGAVMWDSEPLQHCGRKKMLKYFMRSEKDLNHPLQTTVAGQVSESKWRVQ